jgi:hypothetical protein
MLLHEYLNGGTRFIANFPNLVNRGSSKTDAWHACIELVFCRDWEVKLGKGRFCLAMLCPVLRFSLSALACICFLHVAPDILHYKAYHACCARHAKHCAQDFTTNIAKFQHYTALAWKGKAMHTIQMWGFHYLLCSI